MIIDADYSENEDIDQYSEGEFYGDEEDDDFNNYGPVTKSEVEEM